MLKFLIEAFKASKGRMPNNMEMILLRQKAAKQSIDERKVVSMFDRSAVNPNKPIMGGKNIPETEEQIKQRLMDQNKKGIKSLEDRMKKNKEYQDLKKSFEDPEERAMGGRIGYAGGAGKKGVQALLDLVRDKFGKKAITTADKAPIPPKTLERDMFKAADKRLSDKREMTDKEVTEFADEFGLDPSEEYYNWDGTLADARRLLKESEDETKYMYQQYKAGRLDPKSGEKGREKFLEKKLEEAELSGESKLITRDEIEELEDLRIAREIAPQMTERLELKARYPGITDDLLDSILIDDNPQRKAEVLATLDEAFAMMKKGKGPDEVLRIIKNINRTKQADGGRIGLVGGGGINLVLSLTKNFMRATGRKPNPDEIKKMQKVFFENAENKMNNAIDSAKTPGSMSKDEFSMNVGGGFKAIGRRMDDTAKKMDNADKDSILRFIKEYNIENKADGGIMRANFLGGGMGRRGFLKLLGGVGAGIGALKTGILGFGGKGATKEVAKEVVKQSAGTPPPYFFKLAEKIKKFGSDSTPTNERTISKSLKSKDGTADYILEEDMATGDIQIKKVNMERDDMINDIEIMEFRKGEVVEGPGGKPVKTPDEYDEVTESISRIYKDDFNSPDYSEGIRVKEVMEEVMDAPSIKKASGGIARMLGE